MIYQIHFPTLAPISILRLRISLDLVGFCRITESITNSYHVSYIIINQETKEYALSYYETPGLPVVKWTDNLSAELELVPDEMWEQYIAGAI